MTTINLYYQNWNNFNYDILYISYKNILKRDAKYIHEMKY